MGHVLLMIINVYGLPFNKIMAVKILSEINQFVA